MEEEPIKKKRCGYCRKNTLILIICSLCQKSFCIYDRTPESHMCEKINSYKERSFFTEKILTPKIEYI